MEDESVVVRIRAKARWDRLLEVEGNPCFAVERWREEVIMRKHLPYHLAPISRREERRILAFSLMMIVRAKKILGDSTSEKNRDRKKNREDSRAKKNPRFSRSKKIHENPRSKNRGFSSIVGVGGSLGQCPGCESKNAAISLQPL
jgi:hypothetical protein